MAQFFGLTDAQFYGWVVLPVIIFFARVADVTLGTLRIIFVSRGKRNLAPLLGFIEVLIWIVVIGQLVQNINSVTSYLGYALGFAAGNYVGMYVEDRLAMGKLIIRAILDSGGADVLAALHNAGYGVTVLDGMGATGPVKVIYTIVKRRHLREVMGIIHQVHPRAFLTVEDVRSAEEGIFPTQRGNVNRRLFFRKTK